MAQQMLDDVAGITPDQARHVLAHFAAGGYRAGSFTMSLIATICHADPSNRRLLALGFPGYVEAVRLAQDTPDGIGQLTEIAADTRARCAKCKIRVVWKPDAEGFTGVFCEPCIGRCHDGGPSHSCVICAGGGQHG